jgi:hypothetical protein
MRALWPVMHRCGHRVLWDLSREHPDDRAGFARWLSFRDCTPCWWANRRHHRAPSRSRPPRKASTSWLDDWEMAARMPALSGGFRAVAWARKVRHHLVTAALAPSARAQGSTDEAILALVGHAQAIIAAARWIDHRKLEPRYLACALKSGITDSSSRRGRP